MQAEPIDGTEASSKTQYNKLVEGVLEDQADAPEWNAYIRDQPDFQSVSTIEARRLVLNNLRRELDSTPRARANTVECYGILFNVLLEDLEEAEKMSRGSSQTDKQILNNFDVKTSRQGIYNYIKTWTQKLFSDTVYKPTSHVSTSSKPYIPEAERQNERRELFVGNLSFQLDEEALAQHFSKHGKVTNVKIPQYQGRKRGFAFVEFDKAADAKTACDKENSQELLGRQMRINVSNGAPMGGYGGGSSGGGNYSGSGPANSSFEESNIIFVGNLSFDTDQDTLQKHFERCGAIRDVRLALRDGYSKGFAHVEFETKEGATKAIEMNGEDLDGRALRVDITGGKSEGRSGGRGGFRGDRGGYGRGSRF